MGVTINNEHVWLKLKEKEEQYRCLSSRELKTMKDSYYYYYYVTQL